MIALFFDTETTGLKREDFTPEIVQIAAILQDTESGRVLHEFSFIIQCGLQDIPEETTKIHGITTDISRKYGMWPPDVQALFYSLLERCDILVAHNIDFDIEMLNEAWGMSINDTRLSNVKQFCTMRALTPIMKLPKNGKNYYHDTKYPDYKAPRLYEAYRYFFGKDFENAHNAMDDVRACRDVYFALPANLRS